MTSSAGQKRLYGAAAARHQEVTFVVHDDGPAGPNQVDVVFDDEHVVSDAGLVLCQTVAERHGTDFSLDPPSRR